MGAGWDERFRVCGAVFLLSVLAEGFSNRGCDLSSLWRELSLRPQAMLEMLGITSFVRDMAAEKAAGKKARSAPAARS
eukprot:7230285-Prymnesium_polylepis.1